jgi:hypothetical protein
VVHPGEHADDPAEVVALLTRGLRAAEHEVVDVGPVELRHLAQCLVDHEGGQVVPPQVAQGSLAGPADRRAGGGDDDCFGHGDSSV